MRERLKQWWYWFTMPWRFRHLPQCYRHAIGAMACTFTPQDEPPPPGKVWHVQLWIDQEYCGIGSAQLEDANTGEPAPEMEWVAAHPAATAGSWATPVSTVMVWGPKRLGGFHPPHGSPG